MSPYVPLRVRIKLVMQSLLPAKVFSLVSSFWIRTGAKLVGDQNITAKYQKDFLQKFPKIVQSGPFKDLAYVDSSVGSSYLLKLIGSYEAILHPYIQSLRGRDFDTIIDIGSAEGFYLAGFGRMFPDATLVGFELEEEGRILTKELCEKNNLTNTLILKGEATNDNVAPLLTSKTLLICDCEGGEVDILDPLARPEFFTIEAAIIELHDFIRPNAKEILTERFKDAYTITIIPFVLANPTDFPYLASIKNEKELYEIRRERGCQTQEWMILERK